MRGSAPLVFAGIAPLDLPLAWPLHGLRVALRLRGADERAQDGVDERAPSAAEEALLREHLPTEQVDGLRIEERLLTRGESWVAGTPDTAAPANASAAPADASAAPANASAAPANASAAPAAASAAPAAAPFAFLPEAGLFVEGARAAALVHALGLTGDAAAEAMRALGGAAWHGREAHRLGVVLTGGLTLCARQHPPLLAHPPSRPLFGGALVRQLPAAIPRRRHLPEQVHLRKARDQGARAAAALLALAQPDPAPLRDLLQDVIVAETLGPHVPAFFPARAAAMEAGALACGLAPESDTLLWLAADAASARAAGEAAALVLAAHRIDAQLFVSPLFDPSQNTPADTSADPPVDTPSPSAPLPEGA